MKLENFKDLIGDVINTVRMALAQIFQSAALSPASF